jgi:hypothetical protein
MLGADSLIKPHGLMLIPIVVMALVILKLSVRMVSLDDVLSRRGHSAPYGTRDHWIPKLFTIG